MNSTEDARHIVERFLAEAVTAGDSAAMDELVAEEGLKQGVAWFKEAFPDHAVVPEKLLAAEDDHVVALLRASGTHLGPLSGVPLEGQSMSGHPGRSTGVMETVSPTGKRWEVNATALYKVEVGQISAHWIVWDWLSILDQIGALESVTRTQSGDPE
jgi:predicted ester cyclase